jgi:mRNA interferase MazF
MATYLQGDIVLIKFPFSDLTGSKLRPAVIVSNSVVNKTKDIILAQISSEITNDEFSILIEDSHVTYSLREACEVRCQKLFTAEKSIVKQKISSFKLSNYPLIREKIESLLK